jgi:hypothetical protein
MEEGNPVQDYQELGLLSIYTACTGCALYASLPLSSLPCYSPKPSQTLDTKCLMLLQNFQGR